MSSTLFSLGKWCFHHAWRVIGAWVGALVLFGVLAISLMSGFNDQFSIPSAPSQEALTKLRMTFPEASDLQALTVIVPPKGTLVTDPSIRKVIEDAVPMFEKDELVKAVVPPWNDYIKGLVAKDKTAAIMQLRLSVKMASPDQLNTLVNLGAELERKLPKGSSVSMGGEAFSIELPTISITEVIGVVIAVIVLAVLLGSIVAAFIPVGTALVGVAMAAAVMFQMTGLTTINSVTPMLSVMLGLAVGIDYALFVMSRHRELLADPDLEVDESVARATATAGSAVVFAGVTVVIALLGLALAQIPFLTVMGVFAAVGVAFAVLIALTLLPALLGLYGERIRPKPRKARRREKKPHPVLNAWVKGAIAKPWLTVVAIVSIAVVMMLPAGHLHLSLPNSGQHDAHASDRVAYDLTTKHFGIGFNGPLIVTVDLLQTTDPLGIMKGIRTDIEATTGVASVLIATPNQNADTGFVQVIPTTGPDDLATQKLVERLREKKADWRAKHGVETAVTGITAVQIDVSDRLEQALVPFGIFVVGLTILLLTIVFRSIAVPIKAAAGYMLSVGVAFGLTTLVFNDGWLKSLINLEKPMAIISFLPILLMGILFGLAMDYEVFLVSRIREEYVHGANAKDAIVSGFVGSGRVVAAAAVIMFVVFAFFVPEGMGPVKAIAFALAVGIGFDAFVVRMTLVPAVLAILGDWAWWVPKWLDKRMPSFDVEGETLSREIELRGWPATEDVIYAQDLAAEPAVGAFSLAVPAGGVAAIIGDSARSAALLTLTGRLETTSGRARVAGALVAQQGAKVRRASAFIDPTTSADVQSAIARAASQPVVIIDNADLLHTDADKAALASFIETARQNATQAVVLGGTDSRVLAQFAPDQTVALRREHVAH